MSRTGRILILTLILSLAPLSQAFAATFTVNNNGDASDNNIGNGTCATAGAVCTLRAAIEEANSGAGADTINFSGALTINIATTLNLNTNGSITVDGGGSHNVVVNGPGTGAIDCFTIATASNVIKGLVIEDCHYGIYINNAAATGNKIQGNYIGTDSAGTTSGAGNLCGTGVFLNAGNSNIIGTDGDGVNDSTEGNVISGNTTAGITVASTVAGNISGNYIGLTSAGTAALANGTGINLTGTGAVTVGTNGDGSAGDANEGNYISGNTTFGINISSTGAHIIAGNTIGLDTAGTARPATYGIYISATGSSYRIGTNGDGISDTAERNIISGNGSYGVLTSLSSAGKIKGNYIGLDSAGTTAKSNSIGIRLGGTGAWTVGTDGDGIGDASEGNYLSGNTNFGIYVTSTGDHIIAGNTIGLDTAGTGRPNAYGIYIDATGSSYRIGTNGDGTSDTAERNIISSNTLYGIYALSSSAGKIKGNYIGLDSAGTTAKPNGIGIRLGGTGAWTVGTDGDGTGDTSEENYISGNTTIGIYITSTGAHIIAGNSIGLDTAGTARSNSYGIDISATGSSYRIGTNSDGISDTAERNIISGNTLYGIYADSSSAGKIKGNYIGLDSAGTTAKANDIGIRLSGTGAWTVGTDGDGTGDTSEGNYISGNTTIGIYIISTGAHIIAGNTIGLDTAGTARSNSYGIDIEATGSSYLIGTNSDGISDTEERNIISGNTLYGIAAFSSSSGKIKGNYIGLDSAGTTVKPNGVGITLAQTAAWTVGTEGDGIGDAGERNVISGNTLDGLYIVSPSNVVAGNYIGTGPDGTTDLGNGVHGLLVNNMASNIIGGDISAEENLIRYNGDTDGEYGIYITGASATSNAIQRNRVYDNQNDWFVANNATTAPSGLTGAPGGGANQTIITLTSAAGYAVQVWKDTDGDGVCEAQTYLGTATDNGNGTFSYTATNLVLGDKITATAITGTSNTSNLATCLNIGPSLVDPGAKSVAEGTTLSFSLSGSDTGGNTLSYSCSANCPSGLSVNSGTGAVSWTPGYATAASSPYSNVTFRVADPQANVATRAITIVVTDVPVNPIVDAGPNQTVDENATVTLSGSGSDPGGTTITYSWVQIGGPPVTLSNPSAASTTFSAPEVTARSSIVLQLSASTAVGTVSDFVTITVRNTVGAKPIAEAGPSLTVTSGSTATLHGSGTSDTSASLVYRWAQTRGPKVSLSSATVAAPSFTAPTLSTNIDRIILVFQLVVDDGTTVSDPDTTTVTVMKSSEAAHNFDRKKRKILTYCDLNGDGETDELSLLKNQRISGVRTVNILEIRYRNETSDFSESPDTSLYVSGDISILCQDFNDDGNPDLIIGASSAAGGSGKVYGVLGGATLPGVIDLDAGESNFFVTAANGLTALGKHLTSGDLNGDGLPDILFSAEQGDGNGQLFALLGSADLPTGEISSDETDLSFTGADGSGLANLEHLKSGDLNGDGLDDIIVCQQTSSPSASLSPELAALSAGAGSYTVSITYATDSLLQQGNTVAMTNDVTITGSSGEISDMVTGDLNGDGYEDLILSNATADGTGEIYFFFGSDNLANRSMSDADVILPGVDPGDVAGAAMATGDLNGDGYDDLAIGIPGGDGENNATSNAGDVAVIYGSEDLTATLSLSDTSQVFTTYGEVAEDRLGTGVGIVDADSDGRLDVIATTGGDDTLILSLSQLTTVENSILVELGEQNPASVTYRVGDTGVVMLQLKLTNTLNEGAILQSLTLAGSGSGDESLDISAVHLYLDLNADGALDADDTPIGTAQVFSEDDGTVTFADLNQSFEALGIQHWIVVYDFAPILTLSSLVPSPASSIPWALMLLFATIPLVFILKLPKTARILVVLLAIGLGANACVSNGGDLSIHRAEGTFSISIPANSAVSVTSKQNGLSIEVQGAPVVSNLAVKE